MPTPNAMWRLTARSMITSSGFSNTSGSRFAAGNDSSTRSPFDTGHSPIDVSFLAILAIVTGE